MQRRNKVIPAGICAVAVVVGTLGSKLEQGTAKYPLRMRPVTIEKLTGYFEGCRTKAYKDTGGISTVGIGSTDAICGKIDLNRTYTIEEIAEKDIVLPVVWVDPAADLLELPVPVVD